MLASVLVEVWRFEEGYPRSVSGCVGLVPFLMFGWSLIYWRCDEIQMVDFEMLSSDELRSYFSIV